MNVKLKLNPRFRKNVKGMFGKYDFEVGILEDKPHRDAETGDKAGTRVFAGGPVRKASRKRTPLTLTKLSQQVREQTGLNYLTSPFKHPKSADIVRFTNSFFKLVFGRGEKRRAENLLQAIVRNPILRKDYGSNSPKTVKVKGFDRFLIDTGQLFKAIRARCTVRGSKGV